MIAIQKEEDKYDEEEETKSIKTATLGTLGRNPGFTSNYTLLSQSQFQSSHQNKVNGSMSTASIRSRPK
jgi:hypothetical protein